MTATRKSRREAAGWHFLDLAADTRGPVAIPPEILSPIGAGGGLYDLRTNKHFTDKQSPITRCDIDVCRVLQARCVPQTQTHIQRKNPDGRWRCYTYDEILKRNKLSLDLFWIKDQSLTDADSLPAPDILAVEIADELQTAFALFSKIAAKLPKSSA